MSRISVWKEGPDKIVAFRRRHLMTQDDLAATLEVSPRTIANWERGDFLPSKMVRLALIGYEYEAAVKTAREKKK